MTLKRRNFNGENDKWHIRQFLREVFQYNDRREHSWHVARWDYLHWHLITNCGLCLPLEETISIWEADGGQIAAVMNPIDPEEAFLHVHPEFRTRELEREMILHAERTFANLRPDGSRRLCIPVDEDDQMRKELLSQLGYTGTGEPGWEHIDELDDQLPDPKIPTGYIIRSMGGLEEHPARSWASWTAFHPDEPDENYEGWDWFMNIQSAPLYRRDLDIVVATPDGKIASFCTIYYDDATRSAVTPLVGTAKEHQRRGLCKAAIQEGMRRLKKMGCTRLFSKATDPAADALYGSTHSEKYTSETWIKDYRA